MGPETIKTAMVAGAIRLHNFLCANANVEPRKRMQ